MYSGSGPGQQARNRRPARGPVPPVPVHRAAPPPLQPRAHHRRGQAPSHAHRRDQQVPERNHRQIFHQGTRYKAFITLYHCMSQ